MTVDVANQLHSNGFRDLNALDRSGRHMMSMLSSTEDREMRLLIWYCIQGADISMLSKHTEHTILQEMAYHFGEHSHFHNNNWPREYSEGETIKIDKINTTRFRGVVGFKVFSKSFQDSSLLGTCRCHCACSSKGCSPISIFTNSYLRAWGWYNNLDFGLSERYWKYLKLIFMWFFIVDPSKESEEMTCLEFARSVVFEELGISHLCRSPYRCVIERYSVEEKEEIRTEEAGLVSQLEKAMSKYTSLRSTSNARPLEFLVRTWFPCLIERSSPHWDADEASRMATVGVSNIRSDTFSLRGDGLWDLPCETDTAQEQAVGLETGLHAPETAALITEVQNQSMTLLRTMTRVHSDSIEIFARQNLIDVQEVDGSE